MKKKIFGITEIIFLTLSLAVAVSVVAFSGWSIAHHHLLSSPTVMQWWHEDGLTFFLLGLFGGLGGGVGGMLLQKRIWSSTSQTSS